MSDVDNGAIPKEYDAPAVELRLMERLVDSAYFFDWKSKKPDFIIDTPPPYPTGSFHIGNALNWCYIDFVARYKRMQGFNVMFPQGWDCHGLPTEVRVEELHGITKNQVSRGEFLGLCEKLTEQNIAKMRLTLRRLGFSVDWSSEYITMKPEYYAHTQHSFVQMYEKDYIYQAEHPVNWCPRCETAIAFAEVDYETRDTFLNYFDFDGVEIATTRPELLSACVAVAVHPEDLRYRHLIGKELTVPVFGHKVVAISDEAVDPSFGSGVVMICTFGDKQDVRWWAKHHLPVRKAIDKQGRMTSLAGKYGGMSVDECKNTIIEDMKNAGLITKQEIIEQNVGRCWRCKTPIEILSERQWFVKIKSDEILETSKQIKWIPSHMETRLENWTGTMEWDWCISRQRIFATPIPVWYCNQCGKTLVAKPEWLPVDPTKNAPPVTCECGSRSFVAEEDVLDTWMDSSISALQVGGWLKGEKQRLPALRPQGHDIIRTWAFYTILLTKALVGVHPWDAIIINGMVLGEDGHKMSKSRNNFVVPEEVVTKYGADAFRQWAATGGSTGSDIMFRWKDVVAGSRFLQKLWSIFRFAYPHIKDFDTNTRTELTVVDRWLLSKLAKLVERVTSNMDAYQFNEAFRLLRGFLWETFADNYIELVKSRLYGKDLKPRRAAEYTLYTTIDAALRMLSPFLPFFTEEAYFRLHKEDIHEKSWPIPDKSLIDATSEENGELLVEVASHVRRYKSEHGIALNAQLKKIEIYRSPFTDTTDLEGVTNSIVELQSDMPVFAEVPVEIKPDMSIIGPRYKKQAKQIVRALQTANPAHIAAQMKTNHIVLQIDAESINLEPEAVSVKSELMLHGKAVDAETIKDAIVVIEK
ncbi:MAG: valyl-tRNA synthetase [Candidatus Argoarchaeum ethanivorans]|uniref:Valine--tRNA ligase n=1 Tax=Candidatus Argoarchaeum ethanivorans TaxID=2608793 RepID=A0A8B3SAH4_9EURY|nr:MAG: valyl-tRNA synthetase [Candidatus Argoarchaeum ethanivorans]